jgi:hypothetical protein
VCVVELWDVIPAEWREVKRGVFDPVIWEWRLRRPRRVEPIRVAGKLKLFEIGDDVRLRYQ